MQKPLGGIGEVGADALREPAQVSGVALGYAPLQRLILRGPANRRLISRRERLDLRGRGPSGPVSAANQERETTSCVSKACLFVRALKGV